MHALYNWCHLIHADLSEYNLLWVDTAPDAGPAGASSSSATAGGYSAYAFPPPIAPASTGRVHVIDLGQSVDASHPLADDFLRVDATHVTEFFRKKGAAVLPVDDLIAVVTDRSLAPHPPRRHGIRTGSRHGTVPAAGSGMRQNKFDMSAAAIASAPQQHAASASDGPPAAAQAVAPAAHPLMAEPAGKPHKSAGKLRFGMKPRATAAGHDEDAEDEAENDGDDDDADDADVFDTIDHFDGEGGPVAVELDRRLEALFES